MKPYFSIVVPTLDRCETLIYTLRTIFNQNFDGFEIIISDNFSVDKTKQICLEVASNYPNIKYINPGKTLSMSKHWEFALSHAQGEYIAFIGDDDGMVPSSLSKAYYVIQKYKEPNALASLNCEYHWPTSPIPWHSNIGRYPLSKINYEFDSNDYLKKVIKSQVSYRYLPMIYNGFIKSKVIEKIKKVTGSFFKSCIPDVYSGVAVASQIESYIFSEDPLFIYGVSGYSNGASASRSTKTNSKFFLEDSIEFHKKTPFCISLPILVAESVYQCIDAKLLDVSFLPTPETLVEKAVLGSLILGKERYLESVSAIQKYAEQFGINANDVIKSHPYVDNSSNPFPDQIAWSDKILDKDALGMKMDAAGVRDIYGFHSCLPAGLDMENCSMALFNDIRAKIETIKSLNNDIRGLKNKVDNLNNEIQWMTNSFSWKITKPLREMLTKIKNN